MHRGADGLVKVTTHKDRPGHLERPHPAELHLASDPDTHAITWKFTAGSSAPARGVDDWKPTQLMEKVSRFLERQTEPVSRAVITAGVSGQKKWVLQAIDELIAGGHATETPGSRGAKLTSHVHPFCVPDPFSPVPENGTTSPVLPVLPPSRGNGSQNGSDDAEVERLAALARDMGL